MLFSAGFTSFRVFVCLENGREREGHPYMPAYQNLGFWRLDLEISMGLGSDEEVVVEDTDGVAGGGCCGGKSYGSSVSCSICLEVVADNGDRSLAKLQCGHQFHLGASK